MLRMSSQQHRVHGVPDGIACICSEGVRGNEHLDPGGDAVNLLTMTRDMVHQQHSPPSVPALPLPSVWCVITKEFS